MYIRRYYCRSQPVRRPELDVLLGERVVGVQIRVVIQELVEVVIEVEIDFLDANIDTDRQSGVGLLRVQQDLNYDLSRV